MDAFEKTASVEDLFKELDQRKFTNIARPLAAYRIELMKEGFTRREAMRLVEAHSKFIYDMCIEEFVTDQDEEEEMDDELDLNEDFDNPDSDEYAG